MLFVPSHLVTLATQAVDTGLVVDIGHQEALLVPVYEGVPVLRIWQSQPLAGAAIEQSVSFSVDSFHVYFINILFVKFSKQVLR